MGRSVALLILTTLVVVYATPALDLCYEVSWDLARVGGPQRRLVRPVTAIPVGHPLTRNICGAINAGIAC